MDPEFNSAAAAAQILGDIDLADALVKLHGGSLEAVMAACAKAKANLERRDQVSGKFILPQSARNLLLNANCPPILPHAHELRITYVITIQACHSLLHLRVSASRCTTLRSCIQHKSKKRHLLSHAPVESCTC